MDKNQTFQQAMYYVAAAYTKASFIDCEKESSQTVKIAYSRVDFNGYKFMFKRVWLGHQKQQHIFVRVPTHLHESQEWIDCDDLNVADSTNNNLFSLN